MNRFLWSVGGDVRKLKLAAACQLTLAQPPIIYYGTEVGMSQESDVRESGFEACRLPMLWDQRQNLEVLEYYRTLIATRHTHPVLRLGSHRLICADAGVYAYVREHGDDRVAVVLNNADTAQTLDLPDVEGIDVLSGKEVHSTLKLEPFGAAIVPTVVRV